MLRRTLDVRSDGSVDGKASHRGVFGLTVKWDSCALELHNNADDLRRWWYSSDAPIGCNSKTVMHVHLSVKRYDCAPE